MNATLVLCLQIKKFATNFCKMKFCFCECCCQKNQKEETRELSTNSKKIILGCKRGEERDSVNTNILFTELCILERRERKKIGVPCQSVLVDNKKQPR